MSRHRWSALVLAVALGTAGCGPTSQGSVAPAEATKPAEGAAPRADWQAEWDRTVAAATQEGRLTLSVPASELWRKALMKFTEDYPRIRLELTGANSRDFWPRLFEERRVGQYLWDLRVGGPDPEVYRARDDGVLAPVRPLLLLPEVVDRTKWAGGIDGIFADRDKKYLLTFLSTGSSLVYINRDVISKSDFQSDKDLLDPRWKGKIVLQDPRGGAGLGLLTVLLATRGEGFVRDLLTKQNVVVTGDSRQQAEWVARGRYPIGIGVVSHVLLLLQKEGVGVNVKPVGAGPMVASVGVGGIQLMNRAPHPNAAKVFINWLLTQKVQSQLTKAVELNSRRLDVSPGDADHLVDPRRLAEYIPHQSEEFREVKERAQGLAAQLLR